MLEAGLHAEHPAVVDVECALLWAWDADPDYNEAAGEHLWHSRSRGRPFSHACADTRARIPRQQMRPRRMLARERLKRLWKVALTAPSHERVVLIHRYNSNAHPILCNGPLPDPPAG